MQSICHFCGTDTRMGWNKNSAIFAVAGKLVAAAFIFILDVVSKKKMISEGFSAGISRFLLVVTIPCTLYCRLLKQIIPSPQRLVKAGEVLCYQFDHI